MTGDRITVTTTADGKKSYVAEPAAGSAPGTILTRTDIDGDTYFYPSDVIGKVGSVLDPRLFNVTELVRDGYDDAHRGSLPLIVQHSRDARPAALAKDGPLPAKRTFHSIHASTVTLDKDDTDTVGEALDGSGAALKGVRRIWLDGRVKADALDRNLTQIGADTAWQSGRTGTGVKVAVLDTGVDGTHPDLAGRVLETKDFSGSGNTLDKVGHGTHVAATVAGSGSGAPGLRKGVAPDTDLVVGKVLGDDGAGSDSQVIAGMEWAVAQGARVVNMSLGSGPSNGKDAVTTALESLTTSSKTLFVVSAGNNGPGIGTVSAPSIAPHALSVAAVDFAGGTASFSSRGPAANGTVKPEIAAPGVNVVAARATGTNIGTVQPDPNYTALSGTSMAAPHVTGAAALLAQEHPDWSPDRLKHTLMGTAKQPSATQSMYDVGSGVVDVPAALEQTVVADTGAVDFGRLDSSDGTATRTVKLTNTGSESVRLDLSGTLTTAGSTTPEGLLKLSASTLTLAAGASEDVTLDVSADGTPTGTYSGALTATPAGGGQALRIPLLLDRAQSITVKVLNRDGNPAPAQVSLLNADNGTGGSVTIGNGGSLALRIPDGDYLGLANVSMQVNGTPAVAVISADLHAGDKEIVFDARTAHRWTASVSGRETRTEFMTGNIKRTTANGTYSVTHSMLAGGAYGPFGRDALWISPTTGSHLGKITFSEHWRLADAGSDQYKGDSSALYDLAFGQRQVPDDPEHRLTADDVDRLAKVRTTYRGLNEEYRYQEGSTVYAPTMTGLNVSSPSYLSVPRARTEYITAKDTTWLRFGYRNRSGISMRYPPRQFTYEPGTHTQHTWYTGPFAVGVAGQITGTTLQLKVDDFVAPDGAVSDYGDFGSPQKWTSSTRLTRNGTVIADRGTAITATLPDAGRASYQLRRTFSVGDAFPMGGEATATWGFTAGGDGEATTPVHLLNASVDAPLDNLNRARADRPLLVDAAVSGAVGGLRPVQAWVTSDGGTHWTKVSAHRASNGHYRFTAPRSALVSGGFLGVRVSAEDEAGNTVDMVLSRAIPVV
ncbi:S8 family serine peptidase [Streptomyces yanii]|uniref:S8 family serine peptidase n=1 Tax=Streptomyces yanii TaxID=78510 RepID=A0ABV5R4R2_9ACTN